MHATERALLKRGVNSRLANSLRQQGFTLQKLSMLSERELSDLGVDSEAIAFIHKNRPPVPAEVVDQLLYDCNHVCSVCHDPSRGVVIHHIEPWAESRNHDPANLVVLCQLHHEKAHSKSELTIDLTSERLRFIKNTWESDVAEKRTRDLLSPRSWSINEAVWDCFNRQRLLDLADATGIKVQSIDGFCSLGDNDAYDRLPYRWQSRLRMSGVDEYSFYKKLIRELYSKKKWVDLKSIWTKQEILGLVQPGTLIALTGYFRFQSQREPEQGPGQNRPGYYKARGIRLDFTFDAWECTSNSAYGVHLTSGWICTVLGFVRSIESTKAHLRIRATCLAIGTGFTEYFGHTPDIPAIREREANW